MFNINSNSGSNPYYYYNQTDRNDDNTSKKRKEENSPDELKQPNKKATIDSKEPSYFTNPLVHKKALSESIGNILYENKVEYWIIDLLGQERNYSRVAQGFIEIFNKTTWYRDPNLATILTRIHTKCIKPEIEQKLEPALANAYQYTKKIFSQMPKDAQGNYIIDPNFRNSIENAKAYADERLKEQKSESSSSEQTNSNKNWTHSINLHNAKGLENPDNACYIISSLQALRCIPSFRNELANLCTSEDTQTKKLANWLSNIYDRIEKGIDIPINEIIDLRKELIENYKFPAERVNSQEDALLFLQFLLDTLHTKTFSYKTEIEKDPLPFCIPALEKQGGKNEILISLCLGQATNHTQLQDLITGHHVIEEIDFSQVNYDQKYPQSQRVSRGITYIDTRQTISITKEAPEKLLLSIRRFDNAGQKNMLSILPNQTLFINVTHENGAVTKQQYKLKAIIVHRGNSLSNGHYVTYIPSQVYSQHWTEYNDARVVQRNANEICEEFGSIAKDTPYTHACKNGYIYVYEKG